MIFIVLGFCCVLQKSNCDILITTKMEEIKNTAIGCDGDQTFIASTTARSELIIMSCKQHAHIHNSDLINHLNRRHSAVSRLICGPGLDVNIKSWKQGSKQREATNMCNPASWCFYQEAGRLAVHYTTKAPQHSVQDLPCGFSLILALELYWYPVCRDIKGNKAFCANQQL